MIEIVLVIVWILSGAVGSYLAMEFRWLRGKYARDLCVSDMWFFLTMAIVGGPFNLFCGLVFVAGYLLNKATAAIGINPDTVILKSREVPRNHRYRHTGDIR